MGILSATLAIVLTPVVLNLSGPPQDPAATWARLTAMTAGEIAAVRDAARRELSGVALYEAHLAAVARTDPEAPPAPALLEGAAGLALALEDAHAEVKALADRLWLERTA